MAIVSIGMQLIRSNFVRVSGNVGKQLSRHGSRNFIKPTEIRLHRGITTKFPPILEANAEKVSAIRKHVEGGFMVKVPGKEQGIQQAYNLGLGGPKDPADENFIDDMKRTVSQAETLFYQNPYNNNEEERLRALAVLGRHLNLDFGSKGTGIHYVNGVKEAFSILQSLFFNENDKVGMLVPGYVTAFKGIKNPVYIHTLGLTDTDITDTIVNLSLTGKINKLWFEPNNPHGIYFSDKNLKRIADLRNDGILESMVNDGPYQWAVHPDPITGVARVQNNVFKFCSGLTERNTNSPGIDATTISGSKLVRMPAAGLRTGAIVFGNDYSIQTDDADIPLSQLFSDYTNVEHSHFSSFQSRSLIDALDRFEEKGRSDEALERCRLLGDLVEPNLMVIKPDVGFFQLIGISEVCRENNITGPGFMEYLRTHPDTSIIGLGGTGFYPSKSGDVALNSAGDTKPVTDLKHYLKRASQYWCRMTLIASPNKDEARDAVDALNKKSQDKSAIADFLSKNPEYRLEEDVPSIEEFYDLGFKPAD